MESCLTHLSGTLDSARYFRKCAIFMERENCRAGLRLIWMTYSTCLEQLG